MKTKHLIGIIAITTGIYGLFDLEVFYSSDDFFWGMLYVTSWFYMFIGVVEIIINNWDRKLF